MNLDHYNPTPMVEDVTPKPERPSFLQRHRDTIVGIGSTVVTVLVFAVSCAAEGERDEARRAKQCVDRHKYTDHLAFYDHDAQVCVLRWPDGRVQREAGYFP